MSEEEQLSFPKTEANLKSMSATSNLLETIRETTSEDYFNSAWDEERESFAHKFDMASKTGKETISD